MRLNFGHLKVRLSRATFFGRRGGGGGGGVLGKNVPKIDYVILCKRPLLCFTLNSKPYLSCFADYRGGGGCHVRLCPVLFGFYETTDMFFGTLADSDGLVLQRRGHD